jgi:MFS family permease
MDAQGFTAAAVTIVAAVGAGAGLILNPMVGRLSDRSGRSTVLKITYTGAALALALMTISSTLGHFLLVTVLMTVAYAADVVAPALVTDLVAREQLDRWMSLFTTTRWLGAIAGYAGSGYAVQLFGLYPTLLASVMLPVLAVLLLHQIRRADGRESTTPIPVDPTALPIANC